MQGKVPFTIMLLLIPLQVAARQPISAALYAGGEIHNVDYQYPRPLDFDPEDSGDSFGLGITYSVNKNWDVVLDWVQTDTSDVDISNVTIGVNYRFPLRITNLYGVVGAFAGEGKLDWQQEPDLIDPLRDELDSKETGFGPYLGLSYDMREHWSASISYRYFVQEFETFVDTEEGRLSIQHDNMQMVLFGIHYHF